MSNWKTMKQARLLNLCAAYSTLRIPHLEVQQEGSFRWNAGARKKSVPLLSIKPFSKVYYNEISVASYYPLLITFIKSDFILLHTFRRILN